MSLKLALSLAFLAVCSATTFHGYDNYHVNVGVGHIIISNDVGHQVHILINRLSQGMDQHLIGIHVTGNGQVLDTEHVVNQPVTLSGQYQADILYKIFDNFRGTLDNIEFQKLIEVVAQHVEEGHVHPAVLYALQLLAQQHHSVEAVAAMSPYHHQIYNTVQGLFHNIGYSHVPYTSGLGSWYGTHQGYGLGHYGQLYGLGSSYYPGVYGHGWASQSSYGPYASNVYGTVGAGYGHHYWPHVGSWAQMQGGIPYAQQHHLLAAY